jgi:ligand-binding sensor domain-containing protein
MNAQVYNFKNYTLKDGLTQSEVYAVTEDQKGNIWFGTLGGGIIKHDGIHFQVFMEENGLLNNFIRSLMTDSDGILWIGTEEGLCTYDGRTFHSFQDTNGPMHTTVKCMLQDHKGNYWFGTETNGLYYYDGTDFKQYSGHNGLLDNNVYCVFEDRNKNIWAGTTKGAFKISNGNIRLYTEESGMSSDIIRSISEDDSGNLWFGTQGGGISVMIGNTFKVYKKEDGLSSNIVYHIYNDRKGSMWSATSEGITRFRNPIFKTYNETNGLPANVVLCIFKDSFHNLWFGTSGGGVAKFAGERFVHYTKNDYMGNRVFAITQVPGGNMLFGTSTGGITTFDGKNYTLLRGMPNFTDSKVRAFYYTKDTTLWIGTLNDGAFKFDKHGFTQFSIDNGLCSNNITCFTEDPYGRIWVGSSDYGISIISDDKVVKNINKDNGLSSNTVYALLSENNKTIWAGTENGGISVISNPEKISDKTDIVLFNSSNKLNDNTVRSMIKDSSGNFFLATSGGGINLFDGSGFRFMTKKEGLSSNNIYLLIFDNDGNLWAGSEKGLDKITMNDAFEVKNIRHYGYEEGFTGVELYKNACFKDTSGRLWFGTVQGVTVYDPKEDSESTTETKTYITELKLFYDPIENTPFSDSLSSEFPLPEKLVLPYNMNSLTFSYIGIDHRNPKSVKYKVFLKGFDDKWSPELTQTEVTYSNLPPGAYTFSVVSKNENGTWNASPTGYSFRILTPVWKQTWFLLSFFILIGLIVWFFVSRRIRYIRAKNQAVKERLELERNIIELEQKASRLQMNPHFIFNSLNSIQGFIAANDTFEAKKYLAKFARLMRLTLENSREEFIPLSNEIFVLENYLELEKLSSNQAFDFRIHLQEEINPDETEIPPMLLQPFVENAVLHGIKPLKEKGFITIGFSIENTFLVCEITDNGIGIDQIQEKTPKGHRSSGIAITKERLEKINFGNGNHGSIEFIHLNNESKNPSGTKVIVKIPI